MTAEGVIVVVASSRRLDSMADIFAMAGEAAYGVDGVIVGPPKRIRSGMAGPVDLSDPKIRAYEFPVRRRA